ncbi:hypothetical protein TWF730_002460 [Orbilia blumenaviensis]|uniref:Uncharacterized protein n=1 Tax=Orbilia blumenaviensis TaxID=1796055 RepID=A0AAV9U9Z5_9PEZI
MSITLLFEVIKLLSRLRHRTFHRGKYLQALYLNVGFLTPQNTYDHISIPITPITTALEISYAVASYLRVPREFDSKIQVSLLPYGFDTNDHRLLTFISLFPKNLVHKERYIHLLAPRRPRFPSFPAKRYRGRTLKPDDKILPLLNPWKQDALHLWVGLNTNDEKIIRFQNAIDNCQLIIQEKENMNKKCQQVLKTQVARAYKLRYSVNRGGHSMLARRGAMSWVPSGEKRYRCQITDEYFTLDKMAATTIYPHTLMMELRGLDEEVVDMLTGPENSLLMSWPVARMFDEGLVTIQKKALVQDQVSTRHGRGIEDAYFLKVNYIRLLDSRVFAREDWEDREHRERLRWRHIDGKRIIFSDDGSMVPYKDFMEFHSELSTMIFGGLELSESEGISQDFLGSIFDRTPWPSSDSSTSVDPSGIVRRSSSPSPPRWRIPRAGSGDS